MVDEKEPNIGTDQLLLCKHFPAIQRCNVTTGLISLCPFKKKCASRLTVVSYTKDSYIHHNLTQFFCSFNVLLQKCVSLGKVQEVILQFHPLNFQKWHLLPLMGRRESHGGLEE